METQLEASLLACTTNNTQTIRQGEEALQKLLRGKSSVINLIKLIRTSSHASVRQLAAVLLRVKIGMHWIKFNLNEQQFCKTTLLESLFFEPIRSVRLCICYAVAALAKLTLNTVGWPELLEVINKSTKDLHSPENRELGFLLINSITEPLILSLVSNFGEIIQLFTDSLTHENDPKVISAILRATTSVIEFLSEEKDVMKFQPLIAYLIHSLNHDFDRTDEFRINSALEVIEEESVQKLAVSPSSTSEARNEKQSILMLPHQHF